jgi:glyoxalase family protein
MHHTNGLHHITGITSDAQQNLEFYNGFLGQRFIKRTVNFDDPTAYHLYYRDAVGTPGTVLTFFYWAGMSLGTRGAGGVDSIYYAVPPGALSYWEARAAEFAVPATRKTLPFGEECLMISDPDGLLVGLVEAKTLGGYVHWERSPVPESVSLRGFYGALIHLPFATALERVIKEGLGYTVVATESGVTRYAAHAWPGKFLATAFWPELSPARQGVGSIHHLAFQAADDIHLAELRAQVTVLGMNATTQIDRQYFHSVYFMTPADVLFEIATNDIGFTVNEPVETLGSTLLLPPQYESARAAIEAHLPPLRIPYS